MARRRRLRLRRADDPVRDHAALHLARAAAAAEPRGGRDLPRARPLLRRVSERRAAPRGAPDDAPGGRADADRPGLPGSDPRLPARRVPARLRRQVPGVQHRLAGRHGVDRHAVRGAPRQGRPPARHRGLQHRLHAGAAPGRRDADRRLPRVPRQPAGPPRAAADGGDRRRRHADGRGVPPRMPVRRGRGAGDRDRDARRDVLRRHQPLGPGRARAARVPQGADREHHRGQPARGRRARAARRRREPVPRPGRVEQEDPRAAPGRALRAPRHARGGRDDPQQRPVEPHPAARADHLRRLAVRAPELRLATTASGWC